MCARDEHPCLQSAASGGSLKGIAFWEWFEQGQVAPGAEGYGTGLYGITTDDPVWSTIASFAEASIGTTELTPCIPPNLTLSLILYLLLMINQFQYGCDRG